MLRLTLLPKTMLRGLLLTALVMLPSLSNATESTISVEQFNLANYKGKVVYLDFWASWCTPCKASFPWMNAMQSKYQAQGLQIIAISVDTDAADTQKFLRRYPANFPIVADTQGDMAKRYGLLAMPSSYLIGPEGELMWSKKGFRKSDSQKLEHKIAAALVAAQHTHKISGSSSPQVTQQ